MANERKYSSKEVSRIADLTIKDIIYKVVRFLETSVFNVSDLKLVEMTFDSAVTDKAVSHGLGFIPKDAIIVSISSGTASFNYALFTDKDIVITTSSACTVRALIGTFRET